MDTSDSFWQQLDSEVLLKDHGPQLAREAHALLTGNLSVRLAGMIMTADSCDAATLRTVVAEAPGHAMAEALIVGLVPRHAVERLLKAYVDNAHWNDAPWQDQRVLPVVVSTRDGYRFGFFALDVAARGGSHSP